MNNENGIKFNNISKDMLQKAKENNGAVYDFITAVERDESGVLREVEKGHKTYYPDGRVETFVYEQDEFNKAGENGNVVSILRNDVNRGKSASADNQVPGVDMVYDSSKNINFSSKDSRNAIYKNGELVQDSKKMEVQPQTLTAAVTATNGEKAHINLTLVDEDLGTHTRGLYIDKNRTLDYELAGKKFTISNYEDANGQVHTTITPKDGNLRTISSDGVVTNAGYVTNPNALSIVKPSVSSNESLASYVSSGKKLDKDAIVVQYTTTKDINGNEVLDKWSINSSDRNAVFEHNGAALPGIQTVLDHNNNEVITWTNSTGQVKPVSDSNNVIFEKVGSNGELMQQYGTLKSSILGTSSDTTNTVRTIQARFSGSQEQIKSNIMAEGGSINFTNNNGVITANYVDKDGMQQTGTLNEYGVMGLQTNPNGTLKSLSGKKIDTTNWTQDQKNTWATYYDAKKNGASEAEISAARKAVLESGTQLYSNGKPLTVDQSTGNVVTSTSTSSTDPNGQLKSLSGKDINTSNWSQAQKDSWATYYDAKKNGASASEIAAAQKAVIESGTKLYRDGKELTVNSSGQIVTK